tara:strand:+ start:18 stop:731 length:714 start_codon:yes stop_codon:yes gene_type:complete
MKIVIFFINLIDLINKKKIINFFKKEKININSFFDVGAHKGETANLFNKYFKIKKIFCFEVSPVNFMSLKKFTKKSVNISIFNFGLGNIEGENNFNQLSQESSSSTLVDINKKSRYLKKKIKILNLFVKKDFQIIITKVKIRKLKNFMSQNSIKSIDILKIDTEGSEFNIIKGAEDEIKNINYIYFEHHFDDMLKKEYTLTDIHNYLLKNGFEKKMKIKMFFRKSFEYVYKNKYQTL